MSSAAPAFAAMPPLHDGIGAFADRYDTFILDIWGVIHNGVKPFPGTIPCLEALRKSGKRTLLLSNTPDRSSYIVSALERMGIGRALYDHVLTAGESAWLGLKHRHDDFHRNCGTKCFNPGNDFHADKAGRPLFFQDLDLEFVETAAEAEFVLNACGGRDADLEGQWVKVRQALAHDLPMICVNPDLVVHVGDTLYTCAGTFAKFYGENGGNVLYHGKPHRPIYEMAWGLLGKPDTSRMVAVGDSLLTDIKGANDFGIDGVFNITGIHWDEVHSGGKADRQKLAVLLENQPQQPSAMICGFQW